MRDKREEEFGSRQKNRARRNKYEERLIIGVWGGECRKTMAWKVGDNGEKGRCEHESREEGPGGDRQMDPLAQKPL